MSKCEEAERLRAACRVCLRNRGVLNIFISHSVLVKLRACAPIQISKGDGLPENICRKCENRLEGAYTFRERCVRSDRRIRGEAETVTKAGAAHAHLRSLLRTIRARPDLQVKSCNVDLKNVLFQVKKESVESIKIEDNKLHLVDNGAKKECISKELQEGERWKTKSIKTEDNKLHAVDDQEIKKHISKEVQEGERWKMKSIKTEDNELHTVDDQEKKGHIISKDVQEGEGWSDDGVEMGQGENEVYRCRICREWCEDRQLMAEHERRHADRDAECPCEICGKTFHKYYIHKHVTNAHLKPKAKCNVCHKLMSITTLSVHMRRHHAAETPQHQEPPAAPLHHSTLKKLKKKYILTNRMSSKQTKSVLKINFTNENS